MIENGRENQLGRKSFGLLLLRKITPGIFLIIIAIILFGVERWLGKGFGSGIANLDYYAIRVLFGISIIGIFATVVGAIIAHLEYSHHTFTLEEFGIRVREGVLSINELSIPYRQMQDINIERTLLYRMCGLSRVIIESAGQEEKNDGDETDITFDPIDATLAEELRTLLGRKIGVQVIKTEIQADAGSAQQNTSA